MNSKKHKLPRRILAMLLAICMFVTMFPAGAFAAWEDWWHGGDGGSSNGYYAFRNETDTTVGENVKVYYSTDGTNLTKLEHGGTVNIPRRDVQNDDVSAIVFYVYITDEAENEGVTFTTGNQDGTLRDIVQEESWDGWRTTTEIEDSNGNYIGGVDFDDATEIAYDYECRYAFYYSSFNYDEHGGNNYRGFQVWLNLPSQDERASIIYHSNFDTDVEQRQTVSTNNNTVTLWNNNTFVREGYVLSGWNTASNGTGTTYQPGQTVATSEIDFNHDSQEHLYAIWDRERYQGSLDIELYIDGNPVDINEESDFTTYIEGLSHDEQTQSITLSYSDNKVNVGYTYETYNSADLEFRVNEGYVLQAVDGDFIIGSNTWQGVNPSNDGYTVDNVAGDSTLKIYLNTAYTVDYIYDGHSHIDDQIYITTVQSTNAPDFPSNPSDSDRITPYPGGWSNSTLATTVEINEENLPEGYSGWYTTADGTTLHETSYEPSDIKNAAENRDAEDHDDGTPTVIECYARAKQPGLSVEKSILTVNGEEYENGQRVGPDDAIVYQITVTNDGEFNLNNISVTDQLTVGDDARDVYLYTLDGDVEETFNGTIESLSIDETVTIYAKYIVTEDDYGQTLSNTATAISGSTTDSSEPVTTEIEQKPKEYTVNYDWGETGPTGTLYDVNGDQVENAITEPEDNNTYTEGEMYTVDLTYTANTKYYTKDENDTINGVYIFSGWQLNGQPADETEEMGNTDVTLTGTWTYIDAPTAEEIASLGALVTVDCENYLVEHADGEYALTDVRDGYTFGDLRVDEQGNITVTVSVKADPYINVYASQEAFADINHTENPADQADETLALIYNNESGWSVNSGSQDITFTVTCDAIPDQYINGFSKDVIDQSNVEKLPQQINKDDYVIPTDEETTVTIPYDGEVTLLYEITVQGKSGTNFTVTDDGATLVETDAQVTQGEDDQINEFTGMIPDNATSLTFYVSKTFDAEALENSTVSGYLVNTASIAVEEGGVIDLPDAPENPSVTEKVPGEAEEKPDEPDNIDELLDDALVTVECVKENVKHSGNGIENNSATYDFSSYSTGDVTPVDGQDGVFTLTVSIENSTGTYIETYIDQFDNATGKDHIIATGEGVDQDYTVTLKYQDGSWALDDKTAHLKVECEYDLTDIQKTIVTSDQADAVKAATSLENLDEYVLPDKVDNEVETVVIPYGGSVKLVYSITVTGKDGANFVVEDTDAKLLGTQTGITFNESNSTFTGTIPTDANTNEGTITFYVWKEFNKDSLTDSDTVEDQKVLINTATLDGGEAGTTGEDEDTEIVPGEEGVQTFKLTYDGNAIDGAIVENVPDGSDGYEDGDKVEISAQIPIYSEKNVVFIGWSQEPTVKIYSAGENYEEKGALVGDSVTFEDSDITLYAVWGYDTNGDGTADAKQVFITPADITAYTGGQDYSGVVDADGNIIEDLETNAGLPEPGYFITLPYDAQQWVNEQAGGNATAADLSKYLTFTYSGSVEGQTDTTTREWGLVSQGNYDATRYVYSLTAGVVDDDENNTIPVRLSYFTDSNGDGKPSSDEILDENIIMTEDSVCNTFSMTINSGGLNQGEIKATFNASPETTVTDGPEYSVAVGTGTLTVKSVVNQDTTNTNAIVSDANSVDTNVQTAVAGEGVTYLVNDSEVQVPVANDRVQLLVDSVSNNKDFNTQMGQDAIATVGGNTDTHDYELVYMDLVDTQNGNVEVTLGDGDSLTIYWPMPEDANENGEFHVVHYTDMDREETVDNLTAVETERPTVTKTRINGQVYLTFTVSSFSPFALVYETDNGGNQGGGGWTPDGGDDGPDGLNTEDHFSYIVGYAEDYRTGEPTDNEDLWPVKPNNQITRAEVATIFYRLLEDEVRDEYDTTVNDFSDVSADSWYNQTVSTLASMEIVKGYEDGTFRPNAPITRAEFGAIATRFFAETGATYVPGTFSDVTGDEWYANAIQDAVNLGLIGGYEDGTVRPNNNITRAEACAIVNRTLGRVPDADHLLPEDVMKVWPDNNPTDWFYADMQEATNGHEYAWIEEDGHEIEEWTNLLDKDWTDR